MNVFPDGNRNFGGAKWFGFCEKMFCPTEVFVAVVKCKTLSKLATESWFAMTSCVFH